MSKQQFPPGWDEARVRRVLSRYENQTEDEAVAEDEAAFEAAGQTVMEVPSDLVLQALGIRERVVSREAALYQSLASTGAALIAFIGVCHEFIGHIVFPWGPSTLGGPLGWHGMGIFAIAGGLLMFGGTLGLIRVPVVLFALLAVVLGVGFVVFTAVVHHEFHMFALVAAISGGVTAYCHRRAAAQRAVPADAADLRRSL